MTDIINLPGLIDAHVHLRDPGQTQKEDFTTGTSAALAGGFTTVLDMPNNVDPVFTVERLKAKIELARQKAVCDIGFYYGSQGDNLESFPEASEHAVGLKLYLNITTGNYLMDPSYLKKIYAAWPVHLPVVLHAEEDVIDIAVESLKGLNRPVHIAHMPSKEILAKIIKAKKSGLPVTCGVTPHHLFLNNKDVERLGVYGQMKPSLKPQSDVDFLWEHLDDIDIFESDHAPHTHDEKKAGAFGVPGLESTLPLLLTAEKERKITRDQIIDKCHDKALEIFNLSNKDTGTIEVALGEYELTNDGLQTKSQWTPFAGKKVIGKVQKVTLRGKIVYENGKILAKKGSAQIIKQ